MVLETDDIRHYHAAAVLDKLVETIVHFMGRYNQQYTSPPPEPMFL